jgi:hypothetical protein
VVLRGVNGARGRLSPRVHEVRSGGQEAAQTKCTDHAREGKGCSPLPVLSHPGPGKARGPWAPRREPRDEERHALGPPFVLLRKPLPQEEGFFAYDRWKESEKVREDGEHRPKARRGDPSADGQDEAPHIEGISGVGVGPARGEGVGLVDVTRRPEPDAFPGECQGEARQDGETARVSACEDQGPHKVPERNPQPRRQGCSAPWRSPTAGRSPGRPLGERSPA